MKKIFITIILLFTPIIIWSQITISEVKKVEIESYYKPEPYDSLQNWQSFDKLADYKKYIGLKIYLAPYNNPNLGAYGARRAFLFTEKASIIAIDTTKKELQTKSLYGRNYSGSNQEPKFDNILTFAYKPYHYFTGVVNGSQIAQISNDKSITDNYFTILNVLYGENLGKLNKKMKSELSKNKSANTIINYSEESLEDSYYRPIYMLRNDKENDTIYTSNIERFILVPYFVKQQNLYKNKKFIVDNINKYGRPSNDSIVSCDSRYEVKYEDNYGNTKMKYKELIVRSGSIWNCVDVSLVPPRYEISYFFKNDNDDQLVLSKDDLENKQHLYNKFERLMPITDYNQRENDKKLKAIEFENVKKARIQKAAKEKERIASERKSKYISKYGSEIGTLVSENKIKIGMSKEMCKDSWNEPFSTDRQVTQNLVYEIWYYGFGKSLHFKNNELVLIIE